MAVHNRPDMQETAVSAEQSGLAQHLAAQRNCALRMIEIQNRLLTDFIAQQKTASQEVSSPAMPAVVPDRPARSVSPAQKGNVVSLFDYVKPVPVEDPATESAGPYYIFDENDTDARQLRGDDVDRLLARYGADDALAINRKQMAETIFLTSKKDSLFFFKNQSGILFVVCFVGPDACYTSALGELKAYAAGQDLMINLLAQESRVPALKDSGFSTTPIGIWQRIDPLSDFTLAGSAMRRLRYLVNKYIKSGNCRTEEYKPGTDPGTDSAICRVMDQWAELKGQNPPFVAEVKSLIKRGGISDDHRFFLTWRDEQLDNVVVFSRDNLNDGYLMDLEFYSGDMPLGSTEFALSEIIGTFNAEGHRQVSLGLTMGTSLFEHENGSKDVHSLFDSLRKADYLNGDANAQYKNKYRPQTTAMYLARPRDSGKKKLNDLMLMLGAG